MRAVIRTRVEAGDSDQQVLDGFVAGYGDGILTEPPKRGVGLGVWLGAAIGIVMGAVLVVVLLRSWRHKPRTTPVEGKVDADVADEFGRFREEFGR